MLRGRLVLCRLGLLGDRLVGVLFPLFFWLAPSGGFLGAVLNVGHAWQGEERGEVYGLCWLLVLDGDRRPILDTFVSTRSSGLVFQHVLCLACGASCRRTLAAVKTMLSADPCKTVSSFEVDTRSCWLK